MANVRCDIWLQIISEKDCSNGWFENCFLSLDISGLMFFEVIINNIPFSEYQWKMSPVNCYRYITFQLEELEVCFEVNKNQYKIIGKINKNKLNIKKVFHEWIIWVWVWFEAEKEGDIVSKLDMISAKIL